MNNYPDAMISVSLDRQAEKVRQVQACGLRRNAGNALYWSKSTRGSADRSRRSMRQPRWRWPWWPLARCC